MLPDLKGKGLFVFSDPGGAKPVLSYISLNKNLSSYKVISDRKYDFFNDFKIIVEEHENGSEEKIIQNFNPDFLYTGTSYTSKIELRYIEAAKKFDVSSFSFIDHYTNFKERFKFENRYVYPDKICLIDNKALLIAEECNLPVDNIMITGNPYHLFIKNWKPKFSKEEFLRRNGIVNFHGKIISYLPEPLSNVGGIAKYGLDEYFCLELLQKAVSPFEKDNPVVLIKPHPNQDKRKMSEKALSLSEKGNIQFKIIDEDINTLIYSSDLVVGIFSNALIEASFFDKPIFRILKGLTISDPLESMNIGTCIYSEEELTNALKNHL